MVLWNVARWTSAGAALGVLGARFCVRLLQSLLFEVNAHDPLLLVVALVAAWIPARRVACIDPLVALREE